MSIVFKDIIPSFGHESAPKPPSWENIIHGNRLAIHDPLGQYELAKGLISYLPEFLGTVIPEEDLIDPERSTANAPNEVSQIDAQQHGAAPVSGIIATVPTVQIEMPVEQLAQSQGQAEYELAR